MNNINELPLSVDINHAVTRKPHYGVTDPMVYRVVDLPVADKVCVADAFEDMHFEKVTQLEYKGFWYHVTLTQKEWCWKWGFILYRKVNTLQTWRLIESKGEYNY